ncbi:MAG: hypothetical protein V7742_19980 [Halioglobus sp.]
MAQTQTQDMPQETFLTMSANLLHKAFIESARTDAKNLYKQISEGQRVALTQVQMEDKSTVRFDLSLEHSEYRGSLNYSGFRASLATLVGNLVTALQKEEKIPVFNAEHDSNVMMFGVTAVTVENEQPSVMVLGADSSGTEANIVLRLMYIDPAQFEVPAESDGAADKA